jgi:hypothetical protein
MLIEGFRGSYHWKLGGGVPIVGKPDKNEFSHPHDALQYVMGGMLHSQQAGEKLPLLPSPDQLGRLSLSPYSRKKTRRAAAPTGIQG